MLAARGRGFNSWNYYHCNIDEAAIQDIAQALVDTGLRAKGYQYVNIDDCWQVERSAADGTIVVDPARFPSGLRYVADWLHARGFKFGIYTAAHELTCQGRPGSYEYEAVEYSTRAVLASTCCSSGLKPICCEISLL